MKSKDGYLRRSIKLETSSRPFKKRRDDINDQFHQYETPLQLIQTL